MSVKMKKMERKTQKRITENETTNKLNMCLKLATDIIHKIQTCLLDRRR